ncbi:hypothetical protein IHN32_11280 [Deinococcus sp. 14RED07]|uniref:hypothetical protein n=1 Tax=unclassified Deinococcus TaxID=2623546 RepID=UPI001E356B34|nr:MULTISPECIES: hypothetical protein [unclassified Deinococcus]MCD0158373.1 hypothetical protein [Deinococcus sp. 6GRE01]MCD0176524.1 hypothetical protein [Deinococcus sp. 14RED07]
MFGRRVPPHIVFAFSVALAVLCAVLAFLATQSQSWVWAGVAAVLAVWFAVDAFRSFSWTQAKKRQDAEKAAQNGHR